MVQLSEMGLGGKTKGNAITRLIRSFELSKIYRKIKVPGIMMRTLELGNTG